ncbi:MAG: type II secretion system protein M [Rhodocyclaceae bacterium]|nr:MAG: type II secretion system protein M [Rhodocyclaceae bacterium]
MSAWSNPLTEYAVPLRAMWMARQPRERRFLAVLALVVATAVLAQALWSANAARARLHRQLPQLRQQAEVLQRQAGEVRQLLAQPASSALQEGSALLATTTLAARNSGLVLAPAQLQLEGARQVRLRANVPFDRWLEWVAAMQRDARLRVINCRVDATDVAGAASPPGMVRVDVLFALPEPT